jgi:uncharacterized protein YbjQ (UPF0145 family)
MDALIGLGFTLALLILGFVAGRIAERRHFRSINEREEKFSTVPAVNWRSFDETREVAETAMVTGSVVVSVDYFKRFLTGFRCLFGGELRSYAPLLDRARREATLRMKESFPHADAYVNCRLETSSMSKGKKNAVGTVEILASATAIKYR